MVEGERLLIGAARSVGASRRSVDRSGDCRVSVNIDIYNPRPAGMDAQRII